MMGRGDFFIMRCQYIEKTGVCGPIRSSFCRILRSHLSHRRNQARFIRGGSLDFLRAWAWRLLDETNELSDSRCEGRAPEGGSRTVASRGRDPRVGCEDDGRAG